MTDEATKPRPFRSQPLRAHRLLIGFAFGTAPREATLFLLCGVVMALFGPVTSFGAKLIVDAALARNFGAAIAAAAFLTTFLGASLLNTLYYLDFLFAVAEKASAAVNRRLMTLMTGVPGLLHHEHPAYLRELDLLREERGRLAWMTNATAGLIRVAIGLGATLFLLARLDPVLVLLPLLGVVSFWTSRRAQELWIQATEATAEPERLRRHLFDLATTAASGKEVRVFDLVDPLIRRHHAAAETVIQTRDRAAWQKAGLEAVGTVAFGLGYVAAIGVTLLRAIDGEVTPGDVVMTIGLAAGLNGVVQIAVSYGTSFLYVLRVANRYLWLEDYAASARSSPAEPAPLRDRLVDGIEIQNLSFRYPGMATISTAFQDFSRFEFLVRETVGVGQLDRMDDRAAVRLALASAGADDVLSSLPRGMETQLGRSWNDGAELSGGQWQKLSLARTLMRPVPLLVVFDEPTAALDAPTEHALFARLAAAARNGQRAGTVTLLVTHRFSTVRMADLIIVLSNGRIVEAGDHGALMTRGGLYSELYELQARTYR
jgi:ABC-type multidrug transport system fused ATPase/permease subunit